MNLVISWHISFELGMRFHIARFADINRIITAFSCIHCSGGVKFAEYMIIALMKCHIWYHPLTDLNGAGISSKLVSFIGSISNEAYPYCYRMYLIVPHDQVFKMKDDIVKMTCAHNTLRKCR